MDRTRLPPEAIGCEEARTLPGLFLRRVERTPQGLAYRQFDPAERVWRSHTWAEVAAQAGRWRAALAGEGLAAGERVAILAPNSVEWVCCDLAAQSLGLAVVPLYATDSLENVAYILADSEARLLLVASRQRWRGLAQYRQMFPALKRVICLEPLSGTEEDAAAIDCARWLGPAPARFEAGAGDPFALATLVYTSGTTGPPKGVMLSHRNILWNAQAVLETVAAYPHDLFLSFLPLAHMFERTVGYYVPMMAGSSVAYARSLQSLAEDLVALRPTVLVSVPRVYDAAYARVRQLLQSKGPLAARLMRWSVEAGWRRFEAQQGRAAPASVWQRALWPLLYRLTAAKVLARFGGRLRLAVSGGAPLHPDVARFFIGLGLPLLQGYGLTEASPVVSGNTLERNAPDSVGEPLPGVEVRLGDRDELMVRSPGVMLGYWRRPEATRQAIDREGWLHTGDQARIEGGRLYIRGRIKEILVLSNGQKVPPEDLEIAISRDPLFDLAMVVGEGRPFVGVLAVVNQATWRELAAALSLDPDDPASLQSRNAAAEALRRVRHALRGFPGYARPHGIWLTLEPWTIENGLLTPTLKLKRPEMEKRFAAQIEALYAKHDRDQPRGRVKSSTGLR